MRAGECWAIGCRAQVLPTELFCQRHAVMLESDTRRVLERTFRPGRRMSKQLARALEMARNEILFHQTNGHQMPRATQFEWED